MANHHNPNNRPHHPLWGLVSSPFRLFLTGIVILLFVSFFARDLVAGMVGNAMTVIASALYPFAGIIAVAFLVWVWWMARPGRNRRH